MKNKKPSTFRYYPIEEPDLGVLRAYKVELDQFRAAREALAVEFEERIQKLSAHHTSNFRSMWWQLSESVGLDPEQTWGSPEYQVEVKYLDNGFGALLYIPQAASILGMGGINEPDDGIPDDKVTRH
jgi:hypothetical protein